MIHLYPERITHIYKCLVCHKKDNDPDQYCTTRDCCLIKVKFTVCSIIKLATIAFDETSSYLSAPKTVNFSTFNWSPDGCLITIGKHFVTTRVVHLPKRTETSLITESDQSRANHRYCSYARSAQPGPIWTRLCGPCIAAKAGLSTIYSIFGAIDKKIHQAHLK